MIVYTKLEIMRTMILEVSVGYLQKLFENFSVMCSQPSRELTTSPQTFTFLKASVAQIDIHDFRSEL